MLHDQTLRLAHSPCMHALHKLCHRNIFSSDSSYLLNESHIQSLGIIVRTYNDHRKFPLILAVKYCIIDVNYKFLILTSVRTTSFISQRNHEKLQKKLIACECDKI